MFVLEFEKPILELRAKIDDLRKISSEDIGMADEIKKLEQKAAQLEKEIYSDLDSWQKTQVARHPKRPYTMDFIDECTTEFMELHGDRAFRDDPAIVSGFLYIEHESFMAIGHQKGKNTAEKVHRNFGMAHPEGYRKALRLMKMAEKFNTPIVTFIDTPGAYPGIGAEERGQSEAIAVNLREMAGLTVPIISVVLGEGGSGGALALGVSNKIIMLEHSIYSVISPEGCASILWNDATRNQEAAKSLRYTAQDLKSFNIVDQIVDEPVGGAHAAPEDTLLKLKSAILKAHQELKGMTGDELIEQRYEKFRNIGVFSESA